MDWVAHLPNYQKIYNNGLHSSIGMTPHECHFGVKVQNDSSVGEIREQASEKNLKMSDRMVKRELNNKPPNAYAVGEEILIKTDKKDRRVTRGGTAMSHTATQAAIVLEARADKYKYKVKYLESETEAWVSVSQIASRNYHDDIVKRSRVRSKYLEELAAIFQAGERDASKHVDLVEQHANVYGLTLMSDNPGQGNCLFYALSDGLALIGTHLTHTVIRNDIVDFITRNPVIQGPDGLIDFRSFTEEPWNSYLLRMRTDGEWGDHLCIVAAAKLLGVSVTVISSQSPDPIIIVPHGTAALGNIFLGHQNENHYVSLQPASPPETTPSFSREVYHRGGGGG